VIGGAPRTADLPAPDDVPLPQSTPGHSDGLAPAAGDSASAQALIEEARQRQRRRRRRYLLVAALVLVATMLGFAARGVSGRTTARTTGSASTGPPQHVGAMPARIVVWTSDFRVEVVSSRTGRVLRTLATGVAEIHGLPHLAVSPSGVVYFDAARGIRQWVMRVPLAGGRPVVVAEGCMPAISPNGQLLAFVTNCDAAARAPEAIAVRNLATGREMRWAYGSHDHAVSAISWSPDDRSLSFTFVGSQFETGTRVLDTRSAGTLLRASPIPLGRGVQWAGYLTPRVGLAVVVRPSLGHAGRVVLAEVAVSNGRLLRQLITLAPPELATANIYDGTENAIIADPTSRAVLIAGVGHGSGAIYRWAFGMAKPVMIISGSSRAVWAGR